jgi:hypothetical protein
MGNSTSGFQIQPGKPVGTADLNAAWRKFVDDRF